MELREGFVEALQVFVVEEVEDTVRVLLGGFVSGAKFVETVNALDVWVREVSLRVGEMEVTVAESKDRIMELECPSVRKPPAAVDDYYRLTVEFQAYETYAMKRIAELEAELAEYRYEKSVEGLSL